MAYLLGGYSRHHYDAKWSDQVIKDLIAKYLANHILGQIKPSRMDKGKNKSWWTREVKESFSIKSVWKYIRHKDEKNTIYKRI